MTVKECYELLGGDYEGVSKRLPGDNFINLNFPRKKWA